MSGKELPADLLGLVNRARKKPGNYGPVAVFCTEPDSHIEVQACHAAFLSRVRSGKAEWHVEFLKKAGENRANDLTMRWLRLLTHKQVSPWQKLVRYLHESDPYFTLNRDVFVWSPKTALKELNCTPQYLLNFMTAVRCFREQSSRTMKVLDSLPFNSRWTILTVLLSRHPFANITGHDPFEHRTKPKLRRFLTADENPQSDFSSEVWGTRQGSYIFDYKSPHFLEFTKGNEFGIDLAKDDNAVRFHDFIKKEMHGVRRTT